MLVDDKPLLAFTSSNTLVTSVNELTSSTMSAEILFLTNSAGKSDNFPLKLDLSHWDLESDHCL